MTLYDASRTFSGGVTSFSFVETRALKFTVTQTRKSSL